MCRLARGAGRDSLQQRSFQPAGEVLAALGALAVLGLCWYETYRSMPFVSLNRSPGSSTVVDLASTSWRPSASMAVPSLIARVLLGRGDVQPLGDARDVQQAVVPALAVEVIGLLVDEVLVLQELPVEEARPLLDGARELVVRRHDGPLL